MTVKEISSVMKFVTPHIMVLALLAGFILPAGAQPVPTDPIKPADRPPASAADFLGKSGAAILQALGKPDQDHPFASRPSAEFDYYYKSRGLSLVGTSQAGVEMVVFCSPVAGAIHGIKVTDTVRSAVSKWGKPSDGLGGLAAYKTDSWILEAENASEGNSVKFMGVIAHGTALAQLDGTLMLDEFCPHAGGVLPWRAGDPPPVVAGVHLGESRADVIAALGKPDNTNVPGGKPILDEYFLNYLHLGLIVIGMPGDGVSAITLCNLDKQNLAGIHVGTPVMSMMKQWGVPPDQAGVIGIYNAGDWAISVKADPGTNQLTGLTLIWSAHKWKNDHGRLKGVYRPTY